MKRILFFLVVLLLVGTDSLVLAQLYRYGAHNPYRDKSSEAAIGQPQTQALEKNVYNRDFNVNPYFTNPYNITPRPQVYESRDFFMNPYGTIPRRWYDYQTNYQGTFDMNYEDPRALADPYKDLRPYSVGELTNPYVGIPKGTKSYDKPAMAQELTPSELTPPELKSVE
jgi:hypothetical protein